jgi:putative PIN family toxin of toxin-antitoxin system
MKVVMDTNVLFAVLKSRRGASYKLVSLLPSEKFSIAISVPLIIEYEDGLKRGKLSSDITEKDIGDFIDFFCYVGEHQDIFFLWRPFLTDPSDDLVLEVAVAGSCEAIITYNKRHFKNVDKFGLKILDPREFLIKIGVLS